MKQKVLLITPPFTQLNTPYPATAYLKGFLNTINVESFQCDLGIEVILELFSSNGLKKLFQVIENQTSKYSDNTLRILSLKNNYIKTIDAVISFLQHKNPTLAHLICSDNYLPEASRFDELPDLEWAFGTLGVQDKAKHIATLYLEDISDLIKENLDPHFGFSRYAERLARSANSFDELYENLNDDNTFIDTVTIELLDEKIKSEQPNLVALSIPFPGNLYSGLKCGQWIKSNYPNIKVALGGGFANTELRSLKDKRVFEFIDFICLDDGEAVILNLLEHLNDDRPLAELKRTFTIVNEQIKYCNGSKQADIKQSEVGCPDYSDLFLDQYLSVISIANPMHRLWNDGRWNKLTLAHGCYWAKCTFCDISLDYIKNYESTSAKILVDRIETLIEQTNNNGFHFVDEAAPPALMREVALEILRRDLTVVWWTNIRFEKKFTADLCRLLAASGCIAISGGLEVASDRLLKLIDKGVTVEQVTKVADHFTETGIMVHAYLMYGFPTQTAQETIDSLEIVRQLFMHGVIQSGYWHQFAMTAHSPVGMQSEKYNVIKASESEGEFANNDIIHLDPEGGDHDAYSEGLKKSLFNYMHGICFDFDLQEWFDFEIDQPHISEDYIENILLNKYNDRQPLANSKIIYIGNNPTTFTKEITKRGKKIKITELTFTTKQEVIKINFSFEIANWLQSLLLQIHVSNKSVNTYSQIRQEFEDKELGDFLVFWHSKSFYQLMEVGLLVL